MVSAASSIDCQICNVINRVNNSRNDHVNKRMDSDTAHTLTPISCPKCDCKSERNAQTNIEVAIPKNENVSSYEPKLVTNEKKPIDTGQSYSSDNLEDLLNEARNISTPLNRLMILADKTDFPLEVRKAANSTLKQFMLNQMQKGNEGF